MSWLLNIDKIKVIRLCNIFLISHIHLPQSRLKKKTTKKPTNITLDLLDASGSFTVLMIGTLLSFYSIVIFYGIKK